MLRSFNAQPAPVGGMVVDEACAQPAPVGEVIVRRLWAVLAEVCPRAVLNEAQSTPLSEAHLRRVYIDQIDFLSAQRHATTVRLGILCKLMAAEALLLRGCDAWLRDDVGSPVRRRNAREA